MDLTCVEKKCSWATVGRVGRKRKGSKLGLLLPVVGCAVFGSWCFTLGQILGLEKKGKWALPWALVELEFWAYWMG